MVIGGHSGDEEAMAGALAAGVRRAGGFCVFVSLTNGDGGHPTLPRAAYARQKDAEALAAAQVLDVRRVLLPVSSGSLDVSACSAETLAGLIRQYRPDAVVTHWHGSMHQDHTAAYYNTVRALAAAQNPAFVSEQEPHRVEKLYFGDNWEDADGFRPGLYLPMTPEDEARWREACLCFEFFREGFYGFDYRGYYEALHRMRGAVALRGRADAPKLATALMTAPVTCYAARCVELKGEW